MKYNSIIKTNMLLLHIQYLEKNYTNKYLLETQIYIRYDLR